MPRVSDRLDVSHSTFVSTPPPPPAAQELVGVGRHLTLPVYSIPGSFLRVSFTPFGFSCFIGSFNHPEVPEDLDLITPLCFTTGFVTFSVVVYDVYDDWHEGSRWLEEKMAPVLPGRPQSDVLSD